MTTVTQERALRALVLDGIPRRWFVPDRRIYWTDLLLSAAIGWGALAGALRATSVAGTAGLAVIASFALYRATLFIHELTHVNPRQLPWFGVAWNVLVGIPLLLPVFLYDGVHLDHHRPRLYGTRADPEYLPFAQRSVWTIGLYAISACLLPAVMALRFAVLAPLSWLVRPLRRLTLERASSLSINPAYVRQHPLGRSGLAQEVACTILCWTAIAAWAAAVLPARALAGWCIVGGAAATINALRVLAAHRYENEGGEMTTLEQLLDSRTIVADPHRGIRAGWEMLVAPVGLRYHALHHWIPALPYHSLGRAHRHVLDLAAGRTYGRTMSSLHAAVADLLRQAGRDHLGRDTEETVMDSR